MMKRIILILVLCIGVAQAGEVWTPTLTRFFNESVSSTKIEVKASSTSVYGYRVINRDTTNPIYLHLYNAAAANVTVGTTQQTDIVPVPANGAAVCQIQGPAQFIYSTGLTIAITTSPLSSGTTAPGTAAVLEIQYQ